MKTMLPRVSKPGLSQRSWLLQQYSDPRHTLKTTKKWLKKKKWSVLNWPTTSPNLNPIENLWDQLKSAIGKRNSVKVEFFFFFWVILDNQLQNSDISLVLFHIFLKI